MITVPKDLLLEVINKTVDEAQSVAKSKGCIVRVVQEDGNALIHTMELRSNRINVAVENGIVKSVVDCG